MSSPDPLNDSVPSSLMRRMTRSQQSKQFMSLGGASASPRRQTFALEVGDDRSPQRLFVTVESEQQQQSGAVRRRLFTSPSPKKTPVQRRARTTTTTIPLRDPSDDEGISAVASATPKKRGRPRKYAPTPVPGAVLRKRAGTPATKGTPGRPRKNAAPPEEALAEKSPQPTPRSSRTRRTAPGKELASDMAAEATPASSQSKRGVKRKAVDEEPSSVPASSGKKRGRPRKKPLVVEQAQEALGEHHAPQAPSPVPAEPSPAPLRSDLARPTSPIQPADNTMPASEGDIWMDTLSDEATPRPAARSRSLNLSTAADPPSYHPEASRPPEQADDYAPMAETREDTPPAPSKGLVEQPEPHVDDVMLVTKPVGDAASEAMSEASHTGVGRGVRDHDTIAQSEEFSMIFMESVRSLRPDFSAMANASNEPANEIGDNTNLFINKTLESIRNGMQSEDGDDNEHDRSDRSASYNGQQVQEGEGQQEQQASRHYEASQQYAGPEPEFVGYEEPEDVARPAEEYQTQERTSPHDEPAEQDMGPEREHPMDGNDGNDRRLAEEYHTHEQSPHHGPYQQDAEHGSTHAEERDNGELGEYQTQAPEWDADEVELPARQSRRTPAEPEQEMPPTKRHSSPLWSRSPRRTKAMPLSRQLVSVKAMQSQQPLAVNSNSQAHLSPSRGSRRNTANPGEESNLYEDSFSEIPEEVLEAATPRPQRTTVPSSNQSPAVQPGSQSKDAAASGVSGATDTIRSDASRMLTPEKTPSPTADEAAGPNPANSTVVNSGPASARSMAASPSHPIHSGQSLLAPPRPAQDKVTPVGPTSSPQLSALQDANAQRATQQSDHERRPTLSPIVRAGLALQSVTSDQSSPLGPKTLGSPFKASGNSSPRRGTAQPSRGMEQTHDPRPTARQPEGASSNDDPLRQGRRSSGQDPFLRALDESALRLQTQRSSEPNAALDTTRATVNDADEMSWVAEDTVPARMPQDTVAPPSSSMAGNFGSVRERQNPASHEDAGDAESGGEEDIWVSEAQRPTPKQPRQQAFGATRRARRTLLPNTWRRGVQATPAAKTVDNKADQSQEEYSLLSQRSKDATVRQRSSAVKQGASGGVDLSKFFSSPTVLPTLNGKGHPARKTVPANQEAPAPARTLPSNSMFPAVPQMDFQPSPVRRNRLFSSAASSPPATSISDQRPGPSMSTGENLAEQQASPAKSVGTGMAEQQAAPSTPERPGLPVVEQKQNFTPRRGQANQSLFAPASARSSTSTPPQMQLSRKDIERWQDETSMALNPSSDSPEVQREAPAPLPHRTMSPSKSCLRSPLKPRTPGRVVEFAGARSPPQDTRALAATANANARRAAPPVQFKPSQPKQPQPAALDEDKENSPSDASMSDTSPHKTQVPERLSQTVWSKDHWRLLDTLVQLRRKGPFPFDLEAAGYVRRDQDLLGRVAVAGGESMEIEKWHIDVVDAFRAEVGGWDKSTLAKRVFALLVGERRRYG